MFDIYVIKKLSSFPFHETNPTCKLEIFLMGEKKPWWLGKSSFSPPPQSSFLFLAIKMSWHICPQSKLVPICLKAGWKGHTDSMRKHYTITPHSLLSMIFCHTSLTIVNLHSSPPSLLVENFVPVFTGKKSSFITCYFFHLTFSEVPEESSEKFWLFILTHGDSYLILQMTYSKNPAAKIHGPNTQWRDSVWLPSSPYRMAFPLLGLVSSTDQTSRFWSFPLVTKGKGSSPG